jgi:hypothetical protein
LSATPVRVSAKIDRHDPKTPAIAGELSKELLAKHDQLPGRCSAAATTIPMFDLAQHPQRGMASSPTLRESLTGPVALLFLVILTLDEAKRQ